VGDEGKLLFLSQNYQQIGWWGLEGGDDLSPIALAIHLPAAKLEVIEPGMMAIGVGIENHQARGHSRAEGRRGFEASGGSAGVTIHGQIQQKSATLVDHRFHGDIAAVQVGEFLGKGEP
jgi:hypothetical protein